MKKTDDLEDLDINGRIILKLFLKNQVREEEGMLRYGGRVHRGNVKETNDLEDLDINGRIILKLFLNRKRRGGLELYGLGQEHVAGSCKCGNET
jgi:hypothetical protein